VWAHAAAHASGLAICPQLLRSRPRQFKDDIPWVCGSADCVRVCWWWTFGTTAAVRRAARRTWNERRRNATRCGVLHTVFKTVHQHGARSQQLGRVITVPVQLSQGRPEKIRDPVRN
jgi:hypothetical protein